MSPTADLRRGFGDSLPLAIGYFTVSIAFGLFVVKNRLSPLVAFLISLTNFSSAGQFAGVELLLVAATYTEIALAVLVINLRYSLMALSLSQKLEPMAWWQKMLLGFGITDEIYALSLQKTGTISFAYQMGLMSFPLLCWGLGSLCGALLGSVLPSVIVTALGIGLYSMFVAIVVPECRSNALVAKIVLLTALVSLALRYLPVFRAIAFGWRVIGVSVVLALLGARLEVSAFYTSKIDSATVSASETESKTDSGVGSETGSLS